MGEHIEYKVRAKQPSAPDEYAAYEKLNEALSSVDGKLPLAISIPLGLQHFLAMFFGNLTPVIMVCSVALCAGQPFDAESKVLLAQASLLMAGIGTLLQCFSLGKFGARLPLMMGTSFAFVYAACFLAKQDFAIFQGACIGSAVFAIILGLTAKYWVKYIPPIVSACVVVTIGLSLTGAAINQLSRGNGDAPATWGQLVVGGVALIACVLANRFSRGMLRDFYLLVGLLAGSVTAAIMQYSGVEVMFNPARLHETLNTVGHFYMPSLFEIVPQFEIGAILAVIAISIVSVAEIIGNVSMVSFAGLEREATAREVQGAIGAFGLANLIGSFIFCAMPVSTYAQNSSLVSTTKVVNRSVMIVAAIILILSAFCPPIAGALYLLPSCVVGGCTIMLFGAVIVVGLEMFYNAGLSKRLVFIALVSLVCGLCTSYLYVIFPGLPNAFHCFFDGNPVGGVFIVSMILSHALPKSFLQSGKAEDAEQLGETSDEG